MHGPVPAPHSAGARAALAVAEAAGLTAAAAAGCGSDDEGEDVVVREIDVYMCNDFNTSGTQLALLQHPLRPPWRPYEYHKVKSVRVKPKGRRLEVTVPLETRSVNYNTSAEEHVKVKEICLKSSLSEARTSYCVGSIKDGKLLLAPLNYTLQMRPTLPHLNDYEPKANGSSSRGADGDSDDGGQDDEQDAKPALQAVEVQVQKRETERQQQARLNSYAYISSKEDEEAWQTLELHTAEKAAAAHTWEKFMVAKDNDVVKAMGGALDRPAYLRSIIPPAQTPAPNLSALEELALSGSSRPASSSAATAAGNGVVKSEGAAGKAKAAAAAAAAGGGSGHGPAAHPATNGAAPAQSEPPEAQQQLSEASARALPSMLRNVLRQHGVMTLGSIRSWLGTVSSSGAGAAAAAVANAAAVAAKEASALSDRALVGVLLTRGRLVCIRRVYLLGSLGEEKLDPLRAVLLELLQERESFKKGELTDMAAAKGVQ
ncbi:MAG: hypothetical protein WDW36_008415, partial [Sanguina aurantia]